MMEEHIEESAKEQVEDLFRNNYKSLKIYALRFVKDLDVVEDLVQDTFVELWNRREYIELDGTVKAYLFKTLYNKCLNHLNSKAHTSQSSIENDVLLYHSDENDSQDEMLHVKELQKIIQLHIETLPPQCKKIFLLSRNQNLKNREIAELLAISVKSVEKQITKALFELRMHLHKSGFLLFIFTLFFLLILN